ncbi:MAG: 3-demethylubiquinone-9 3-methyltransferase [uncultured bacterium]|nr:MAG: 3-demethylubiquinone-9 3-methyltransferase [uncultured bacterium]
MKSMQEKDIRPESLMNLKIPALKHDIRYLRKKKTQFIKINCPACGLSTCEHWSKKAGFNYEKCLNCRTIFMNPRATEGMLQEFYLQSKNYKFWNKHIFPASENVRKEKIFKPRLEKIIQLCKKYKIENGILLEIGAAFGTFCEIAKDSGFFRKIIAVEPTPSLAYSCRARGIDTIESTVENLKIDKNSVDIIINFEVIEHLFNPLKFITQSVDFLKRDGIFICTCPNGEGIGTLVLKEKANYVNHEHLNYFNPFSIEMLLKNCGLSVLEINTPGELDIDNLNNTLKENKTILDKQIFIKHILTNCSDNTKNNFQSFLKQNMLSSHLWIVGIKQ